jgi:Holliday junction resolvasome RuvABC endonuclease subunit
MTVVSGWDLSSRKTAIVWHSDTDDTIRWISYEWKSDDHGVRAAQAFRSARKFTNEYCQDQLHLAYIEAPFIHPKNTRSVLPLAFVSGSTQASLHISGAEVTLVPNTEWKKSVVGNGNASKEKVTDWFIAHTEGFGGIHEDQDLIDAACVYFHGARVAYTSRL